MNHHGFSIVSEPTQIELDGEAVVLCDLGSLLKMYRKLSKNNLYYSKTGYLKGDKAEEIRQV